MVNNEEIKRIAEGAGGKAWAVLSDIVDDVEFKSLLNDQEKGIVSQLHGNPGSINSYKSYFPDIVAKYYGWQIHKEIKLNTLKKAVADLSDKVEKSRSDLDSILEIANLASGATALIAYAKIFEDRANKHADEARIQFRFYVASLVILAVVIGLVFFFNIAEFNFIKNHLAADIQLRFSIGIYAIKAILLVFFFQISQFFRKSFNAEKHLEEVYNHRSDVLSSLHAVYVSINDQNEKDKILSAGALFAYERGETGYITTKEGAGSADGLIEGIFSKMFNR